ncbi:phosphomevalonate kinase [Streptomyces davaonensis JCM 4913]|uniref:Phosphomevalonate kinase n=1 Tax=Streptomyces davaonensis (strain DSM 101723 / JCM 4913 / KCC S-0913 / 768) TaxID=1214101 RepID=K4R7V4_STRDJ|nr:phosphomevalonate kinase [Streptomyces davaonensis]CCK32331.1 phosphomevalonate kinase [Streptomyces davaonensis JCM 4913]
MTVVRRAPGKLFVAGEYAVVDPGNPAILVAVDRHVTVTVTDPTEPGVQITSDLGPTAQRHHWKDGRLGAEPYARSGFAPVLSAIDTVARLLSEHGAPAPEFSLSIESGLHDHGTKYGLGSSGAVTVATVDAVAAYRGLALSDEERFRLALIASAELDPKGSGGDLAASTWGGWIAYRAPDRIAVRDLARTRGVEAALRAPWPGFGIRRLPGPEGLSLEVGWTGHPASTTALVSGLHRRTWRGTPAHRRFVRATTDCVRAAISALERGDDQELMDRIRQARRELTRLDDEMALGIHTARLAALCEIAEAAGGAAKPSGAGGGDCGIALLAATATRDIARLRERWAAAGVVPLPIRPAAEGNPQ